MYRCQKCGRYYGSSLRMDAPTVRVAKCRVCPADRVYLVCERCADLNRIQSQPCPSCGAKHFWEITGMVQG